MRGGLLSLGLVFLFCCSASAGASAAEKAEASSPFWPQPTSYSVQMGSSPLALSGDFKFSSTFTSDILKDSMRRYEELFNVPSGSSGQISECSITITGASSDSTEQTLLKGADDSYLIKFTSQYCSIEAATIWGGINGMETLTQVFERDPTSGAVTTKYETIDVSDNARFSHRGVMIDTARHFLPVEAIARIIDASKMSKFNVIHLHLVDAQSFPFDSSSNPKLVEGAYSQNEVYSEDDISYITEYAVNRGIRPIFEIDVPGHAASWSAGYPELLTICPDYTANINNLNLNPSLNETYSVLQGVLADIKSASASPYLHLGGDEVVYNCWAEDPSITEFMAEEGFEDYDDVYAYFIQRAEGLLLDMGVTPIHWEEVFLAGVEVVPNTIFQVWQSQELVTTIAKAKFPVIASPADPWYLDTWTSDRPVPNRWQDMYAYDPAAGLDADDMEYLLGGEVVMFGEYVDEENIESFVFPRSMAVGERLWSSASTTDEDDALIRIDMHRCRMKARGFRAGPVQPGHCAFTLV